MAGPYSEEQLYYPAYQGDQGGTTAGIIGRNTDRAVNQFNLTSEENATNIRAKGQAIAQGITNAYQGYRQGKQDSMAEREADQRYQLGQQQQNMNQAQMEEQQMQLEQMHHHQDYMNGAGDNGSPRWQAEENAQFQHNTQYQPQMDQLGIKRENAAIEANQAQGSLARYQLDSARTDRNIGFAANQIQGLVGQKDALEQKMQSGPPDAQTATQLQQVNSQLEQMRGQWSKQGLKPEHIAQAERNARIANMQGMTGQDVQYMLSTEGQNAHAALSDVENKTRMLEAADTAAKQFYSARAGSADEEQAKNQLQVALHQMGPDGAAALQNINEGQDSAFGLSVDTGGLHTTSDRIRNAMGMLHQSVAQQHQAISQQYGNAPSNAFRGRLMRLTGAVDRIGNQGTPQLFGGGMNGINPMAANAMFIKGNQGEGGGAQGAGPGFMDAIMGGDQNHAQPQGQPQVQQDPYHAQVPPAPTGQDLSRLYNANYTKRPPQPSKGNYHGGAPSGAQHGGMEHTRSPWRSVSGE